MFADLSDLSPWLSTAIVAVVACGAAAIVHRLAYAILKGATHRAPVLRSIVTQCRPAAALALPLIALQAVLQGAPDELRWVAATRHASALAVLAALTWFAISTINGLANGIIGAHPSTVDDNLQARRIYTQTRVLSRSAILLALIAGLALMLMTFPGARQLGASLLASAGVVGIVAGLAAKPVLAT